MHDLGRDIPDLTKVVPDENDNNNAARKQYREQMVRIECNLENIEVSQESSQRG